jgi:hypothetical protein
MHIDWARGGFSSDALRPHQEALAAARIGYVMQARRITG